ncbi:hypothetical protein ROJ8625_00380 [Roseivivax jejudonensis]|uniref:Type II secretion system protein H n=1 Tax=Roseivivax jejudonensis TaxID=1529041 RepID=A0A1X6Y7F0_9RHOB|nr:prepilin-type N-terminal cleavage/methylation domain-containing protein [Roseivivax jejudonensis]SLN12962.1 hypothetical protein ROJ8625_00380 [Roseivivax jejudonensis]
MPRARPSRHGRGGDAGVTLLEVLIVLALIGTGAGLVSLSLRSGDRADWTARQDAELLAARLSIATEESLLSGRAAALDWRRDGYSFVERGEEDWRPHGNPRLAEWQTVSLALSLAGDPGATEGRLAIGPDAAPPPSGIAVFRIGAGANVAFDGLSAYLGPVQ